MKRKRCKRPHCGGKISKDGTHCKRCRYLSPKEYRRVDALLRAECGFPDGPNAHLYRPPGDET